MTESVRITPGMKVLVRTAFDEWVLRIATTGIVAGHTFQIVWARRPEAAAEDVTPWPSEDVRAVSTKRDEIDGGWIVECVDLPGCMSQGETEEEAIENLVDAIGGVDPDPRRPARR